MTLWEATATVLVVDDEPDAIRGATLLLESAGARRVDGVQDSRETLARLAQGDVGVVLLDLSMPYLTGEELLPQLAEAYPGLPVVVLTGSNQVDTAVRCMRAGAFDYIVKPVEESRLVSSVERALEVWELRAEYSSFRRRVLAGELERPEAFAAILTQNATMRSLFQYLETVARTSRPLLVTGETGVGKELVAEAIHALSGRPGALVKVNVAGLDDNVFSDTLFGHSRGAFTGAEQARSGLVQTAGEGTLLLDEIGDLEPKSQVKLLRLLQEREYYPLGSDVARVARARFIAATNRDLAAMQQQGQFRADLFYRLQSQQVRVPPLRSRLDDLPLLVDHLLERAAESLERPKPGVPAELFSLLATYHFPGNVRELEAMLFDALGHTRGELLDLARLEAYLARSRQGTGEPPASAPRGSGFALFERLPTLKEAQRLLLQEAMRRAGGNQTQAAKLLGITQPGLSKALKRQPG